MISNETLKRDFLTETGWAEIPEYLEQLEQTDEAIKLLHLHEYITNLVNAVNSDFIPSQNWNDAIIQAGKMSEQFELSGAMQSMDVILIAIAPFVTNSRDAATAAGHAFSKYVTAINADREAQKGKVEEMIVSLEAKIQEAVALLTNLEPQRKAIEEYKITLLDGIEGTPSISKKVKDMVVNIEQTHSKATDLLEELVGPQGDEDEDGEQE